MIVVAAQYVGVPGSASAVRPALARMATFVQEREPGCLPFQVSRALDHPDEWRLFEVYRDDAAFDAQRSSAHLREILIERIVPLLKQRRPRTYRLVIGTG
jgi:(4S)-4-hydroxy-5-phosphonooxypentane-2,3-dione isomerase